MLGQCTPISHHTEANGCIFFAAGVGILGTDESFLGFQILKLITTLKENLTN